MTKLFVLLATLAPFSAMAAPGPACVNRMITAVESQFLSPCGMPQQDPKGKRDVAFFTYADIAWGLPRYIAQENCGHDSPDGLGVMRIKFKLLAHGDCEVRELKSIR
jgi:hypothetical protein